MNLHFLRTGILMSLALAMVCGCASMHRQSLKANDTVVFLGDSITAAGVQPDGYVTLVTQAIDKACPGEDIKVIGAGISGNKVPDLQARLDTDVIDKHPTVVVIYIGINDVWHWQMADRNLKGTTKPVFEAGLRDIIGRIRAAGSRVILCTPSVIGEKHDGENNDDAMLDAYSAISRRVAKDTGSQLLDLRKEFKAYLAKNNPENLPKDVLTLDGVHLNPAGNRFVAGLMLDALDVPRD